MTNLPELTQDYIREFVIPAHSNLEKVKEMLTTDPRLLNAMYEDWQETGLGAASHVGHRPIAEYLLAQGADLTIYAAAMLGRRADVADFLARDPDLINSGGAHGISLLFHAALSGDTELTAMLRQKGNTQSPDHPLHAATMKGHVAMVKWLLAQGADVNTPNFQKMTPLQVAEAQGQEEIAAILRQHEES